MSVRDWLRVPLVLLLRRQWALGFGCIVLSTGCGSTRSDAEPPKPIAECQQYETALAHCMGQPVSLPLAAADAVVGKSSDEREEMRSLCQINLQRITSVCR
jgi:hypothetical protein